MEREIETSQYLLLSALAQHCTSINATSLGQQLPVISGLSMFYTLETAPALAAEQRYFSYLSLKIGLELNALLDQSVSRGNSKYNSSFYIIILNITRPKCSSYQLNGACKSCLSASWKPRGSLYLLAEAGLFSTG